MAGEQGPIKPLGERLWDAGWRQGCVFTAPLVVHSNQRAPGSSAIEHGHRPLRGSESLVLISQECDIVAPVDEEPFVEALVCAREKNARYVGRIDRNSARKFLIDPASQLVARAPYRLLIAKEILTSIQPAPWPSTEKRHERFVRWLGRRFDRPAIPDALYDVFQRPLETALETLDEENLAAFNHAVYDVRVSVPANEAPPFDINVLFVARGEELTRDAGDAVQLVEEMIRRCSDPELVCIGDVELVTEEQLTVAEYFATRPMWLEFLTYHGDEVTGAEPPWTERGLAR